MQQKILLRATEVTQCREYNGEFSTIVFKADVCITRSFKYIGLVYHYW